MESDGTPCVVVVVATRVIWICFVFRRSGYGIGWICKRFASLDRMTGEESDAGCCATEKPWDGPLSNDDDGSQKRVTAETRKIGMEGEPRE